MNAPLPAFLIPTLRCGNGHGRSRPRPDANLYYFIKTRSNSELLRLLKPLLIFADNEQYTEY
jgi:hypothetical protein